MSIYVAALSERELTREDFGFLFSHDPDYEERDSLGGLRCISGKYGKLHFSLFQMNDVEFPKEPTSLTLVLAYSLQDVPHPLFEGKHKKHAKDYDKAVKGLIGLIKPQDMKYAGHANGNYSNTFFGIDRKALSDLFADQSRTTFKTV